MIPPNRRNSSLVTTDISLGASVSFSANLDAVVTLVFDSASRSIENSLLASSCCLGLSCGTGCPKPAGAVNHSTARPIDRNRLLPTWVSASGVSIGKKPVLLDGYRLATPDPPPVSRPVGGAGERPLGALHHRRDGRRPPARLSADAPIPEVDLAPGALGDLRIVRPRPAELDSR